jgi:hypothetical protein
MLGVYHGTVSRNRVRDRRACRAGG